MKPLNFRQIHLDFHTSEKIDHIGAQFDKKHFQENLKRGHINSITLFSKCHHGWAYHPTEANVQHPNLGFDLLEAQIQAAHEIGVKTPVYISAGLDEKIARKHPDWLFRNKDESTTWASDFNQPGYHLFCFNSPYLDVLLNQIEEVVKRYDADGIFLDIVHPKACYCQNCIDALIKEGKDPYDQQAAEEYGERLYAKYTREVRASIDRHKPNLPVFHNGGHIAKGRHDIAHMNTHLELESLPTGGWGYDHFPASAKYVVNEGMDFLGMTGKFHTTWGEFGGFKHPNALIYETSLTIAMGGKCSIGDQLHPNGQLDPLTYDIIGQAYALVEEKEPWLSHVKNVADIALLCSESIKGDSDVFSKDGFLMDTGANRMLLQTHYLYELIDAEMDFEQYKLIILPDNIRCDQSLTTKLQTYLNQGGKLLLSGKSGLATDEDQFALDIGCTWDRDCKNTPNYFNPDKKLMANLTSSYIMYSASEDVTLTSGESLGAKEASYFNRTTFEFCSHQHAPSTLETSGPGLVATDNTIYIPWHIFSEYAEIASLHLKDLISASIDLLLADSKTLTTNLPSQGIVTLMNQEDHNRSVLHVLYGSPVLRGFSPVTNKSIEVIEDLIPIHNTTFELKVDRPVRSIYLAPSMKEVAYKVDHGCVTFILDEFTCHQMVVIDYRDE